MRASAVFGLYIVMIIINLASIYFLIDMSGYDEMINYMSDGEQRFDNPQVAISIVMATGIFNLLFISTELMKRIINME